MNGKPRKYKYANDTAGGIRTLTQLRKLPSGELTDEEFVKQFFDRFEANALIMVYTDQDHLIQSFGRLRKGCKPFDYYRRLALMLEKVFKGVSDFKEI